jgi:hypothetical protein
MKTTFTWETDIAGEKYGDSIIVEGELDEEDIKVTLERMLISIRKTREKYEV